MLYDVLILDWSWWNKSYNYAKNGANVHAHSSDCNIAIYYEFSSCKLRCLLVALVNTELCSISVAFIALFVMFIT